MRATNMNQNRKINPGCRQRNFYHMRKARDVVQSLPLEVFEFQLDEAMSSLVWPQSWPCWGQEVGPETSWAPSQPELTCHPVITLPLSDCWTWSQGLSPMTHASSLHAGCPCWSKTVVCGWSNEIFQYLKQNWVRSNAIRRSSSSAHTWREKSILKKTLSSSITLDKWLKPLFSLRIIMCLRSFMNLNISLFVARRLNSFTDPQLSPCGVAVAFSGSFLVNTPVSEGETFHVKVC